MTEPRRPPPELEPLLGEGVRALETEPRLAAEKARQILATAPNHLRGALLLGIAQRKLGDIEASAQMLQRLAAARPAWAPAQYELGVTLGMAGRHREALEALLRAARITPDIGEAWRLIADLLLLLGDPAGADKAYANHVAVSTGNPQLRKPAAALCEDRLDDAHQLLIEHLDTKPADAQAMRMLAEVHARMGRLEESERMLARCLDIAPDLKAARYNRACVLNNLGRPTEALVELDLLIAADPLSPTYLNLRANALTSIGEYDRAIADFATVLAGHPRNAKIWLAYGHSLRTAGRRDECIAAYRRSIELAPALGEAYWSLANLKTFRFGDDDLAAMRAQLARDDVGFEDRVHFHFALGKALEDRKEYAPSFEQYSAGNAVRRPNLRYDPDDTHRFVERSKSVFTREFFAARAGRGCPDDAPIFVVGMPRSGSTLVEQILSSHSRVEGTMELQDMAQVARSIVDDPKNRPRQLFPEVMQSLDPETLRALGERYLAQTRIHRKTGAPHFVDKMPNNWMHAGLIHLILPNAKIVDTRRYPMSGCFSNFKQLYARGHQFAYSLEDIARYYLDYVDLMAHFDEVLPGRVHRVVYERMVEDTEAEVRRLLDYCGLPFEEPCLRFYETERAVRTPSSEQVRQPIFRDGVEQWKHYEPWLGPLATALGPALETYPDPPSR
ncbi:MAG TPA: sulfotransferase [Steroidobacteraceae bacterium]|nr:sulfotransferase [Steroidobacteraceae bacterium]